MFWEPAKKEFCFILNLGTFKFISKKNKLGILYYGICEDTNFNVSNVKRGNQTDTNQ